MQAIISGQLGRAIIVNGDRLRLLDVASSHNTREFSAVNMRQLLQGATDLVSIEADSDDQILRLLKNEWCKDRALLLFLILIDSSDYKECRLEAADVLSDMLESEEMSYFILCRLSAKTLPEIASIDEAFELAARYTLVRRVIERLQKLQPSIYSCREAWDSLDLRLFEGPQDRDLFEQRAIDIGLFYKFAAAMEANDIKAFSAAQIDAYKDDVLSDLMGYRDIVSQWSSQIAPRTMERPGGTAVAALINEEWSDYEDDDTPAYSKQGSDHEAYAKAKAQIREIKKLTRKLDIDKAQRYLRQLITSQVGQGDHVFAAKSLCNIASYAVDTHQYSFALDCMKQAVKIAPEDGWSWGQLGDVYLHLAEFDQARDAFQKASQWQEAHFGENGLARILRYRGESKAALEALLSVERHFSSHHDVWNTTVLIGELYREQGEYELALKTFSDAIQRFPEEASPRCGLANTLTEIGELGQALTTYQDAIKLSAPSVDAYVGVGKVYQERGELDKALDAYNIAKQKFPLEPLPCTYRAEVLRQLKNFDDATAEYEWLRNEFPFDFAGFKGPAELLREQGRYDSAEKQFDEAIKLFPNEPILYVRRAYLFKQAKRLTTALQAFSQVCQMFPTNIYARLGQADLFKELGKFDEALDLYGDISDPANSSVVKPSVAAINLARGDFASVLANKPSFSPRNKAEWVSLHVYGMALFKAGRIPEMIELFAVALEDVPFASQKPYFANALALAHLREHDYATAASLLSEREDAISQVIAFHTAAATNDVARAEFALNSLENDCPENLIILRDELAAQFKLKKSPPHYDSAWIFNQECNALALNATFQAAA